MDLNHSPAELAFRDEVRSFLAEHLAPEVRRGAELTPSVFVEPDITGVWQAELHRKGWLAYHWPVDAGGTGWTPTQRYIFEKECALAGTPSLPVMGLKLVGPVIAAFGTAEQKAQFLPRILSGEDYWCQGFSEPGSGSDLASLQCRAERVGDKYQVNGTKIWTTHAHHANRVFCLVRTSSEGRPQQGISFLLMDMQQPGITVRPIVTMAGDHEVNQVFFDNAEAPAKWLIGAEGDGWRIAKFLLENERGGSCHAPKLGADLEALAAAAADEPDGRGGILSKDPAWRRRVARLRLEIESLEMIELKTLAELAKGTPPGPQTSLAKLIASNLRQEVDLLAVDLFGDAGLELEQARPLYGDNVPEAPHGEAARLAGPRYLNSRAWTIFGGSNEVQAGIIAKTVLGLG